MARNRRKTYDEAIGPGDDANGIPCSECGCRHSYVIRTVKWDGVIRRTRRCRYCGRVFYTTET